ncbi:MAG TPA: CBS domain-containing protein, partial [Acidobacteriota bacterium]
RTITQEMLQNQARDLPIHNWDLPARTPVTARTDDYRCVYQFMSTDLYTVRPYDLVELAAFIMDIKHVRHVPVEDDYGKLIGIISSRDLLHLYAAGGFAGNTAAGAVMKPNPITVQPKTTTLDAIEIMRRHNIGCLPVVEYDRLVGIITIFDLLRISSRLLQVALQQ